jgi:hypothetical protein
LLLFFSHQHHRTGMEVRQLPRAAAAALPVAARTLAEEAPECIDSGSGGSGKNMHGAVLSRVTVANAREISPRTCLSIPKADQRVHLCPVGQGTRAAAYPRTQVSIPTRDRSPSHCYQHWSLVRTSYHPTRNMRRSVRSAPFWESSLYPMRALSRCSAGGPPV